MSKPGPLKAWFVARALSRLTTSPLIGRTDLLRPVLRLRVLRGSINGFGAVPRDKRETRAPYTTPLLALAVLTSVERRLPKIQFAPVARHSQAPEGHQHPGV